MTTYLLNSAVLTAYGEYVYSHLTVDAARVELQSDYTSAVGHQGSAEFCSQLLGIQVPLNRIAIEMQVGDRAVVVRVKGRIPEGGSLTTKEVLAMPYEVGLLVRRQ